jgi:hypothetical protein
MKGDRDAANRRYGRVFRTLTQRSVDTSLLRRLTKLGLPLAQAQLAESNLRFIQDFVEGPEFEKYFLDKKLALEFVGGVTGMAGSMTSTQLSSYQASVDAASLVFAHSAVDAAASDLCWVCFLIAPDDWLPYIRAQKVSVDDVRNTAVDDLLRGRIEKTIEQLEQESILKRADRLFELCRPPSGFDSPIGFKYDRSRLETLDRLRHDIVHGEVRPGALANVERDVGYLFQTGLHLWAIVNHRYGVQIDVRHFFDLKSFAPGSSSDSS